MFWVSQNGLLLFYIRPAKYGGDLNIRLPAYLVPHALCLFLH